MTILIWRYFCHIAKSWYRKMEKNTQKIPQHLSLSKEHYTPISIVNRAREVFNGDIDTDPATNAMVNALRVNARVFYTEETNGLNNKWEGNTFLNPPGGKNKNKSSQFEWFFAAKKKYMEREIDSLIYIGFNLEILRLASEYLDDTIICLPKYRIAYDKYDHSNDSFVKSKSPPHATVIIYLGEKGKVFAEQFNTLGKVWKLDPASTI